MTVCATCELPLVLEVESDGDDEMDTAASGSASLAQAHTVPDDVQMNCGCHFHWQCLLDAYETLKCPSCSTNINSTSSSGTSQILCTLHNEGGLQPDLDIHPLLTEEVYLKAYPEERRARAFLEFCRQGDVPAIIDLLKDSDSDSDSDSDNERDSGTLSPAEILLYRDPIDNCYSGLHMAALNARAEVIWLLLLLASPGGAQRLPREVFYQADALGAVSLAEQLNITTDIRSLRDSSGLVAAEYADFGVLPEGLDPLVLFP